MRDDLDFTFRPLAAVDLPLLHRWRNNPVVARWWHPPPTYDEVVAKYTPRIAGEEPVRPYIASCDGTPVGYLQSYRLADVAYYPEVGLPREGTAAVELFLGEDAYRGRRVGSAMLRAFLRAVVFDAPDVTACYIDPHPENGTAIRSYARAGFRDLGHIATGEDGEPAQLMHIEREAVLAP